MQGSPSVRIGNPSYVDVKSSYELLCVQNTFFMVQTTDLFIKKGPYLGDFGLVLDDLHPVYLTPKCLCACMFVSEKNIRKNT